MNSIANPMFSSALGFLQHHEAEYLAHDQPRLVDRCIAHLVESAECSASSARDIVMQALGELSARRRPGYIDCNRTTSFALFLVDSQGIRRTITIAALLDLIDPPAFNAATA